MKISFMNMLISIGAKIDALGTPVISIWDKVSVLFCFMLSFLRMRYELNNVPNRHLVVQSQL